MKVVELRALRGPNAHDRRPVVRLLLDLEAHENAGAGRMPVLVPRLLRLLPGLRAEADRLERAASLARLVERAAVDLLAQAGMDAAPSRTQPTHAPGQRLVTFRHEDEEAGLRAARHAVALVQAALDDAPYDVPAAVAEIRAARDANALGPSTRAIADEARRRGIPVLRPEEGGSLLQLGHGARARRVQATMTGRTTALGVEIADDKERTKRLLARHGIPVPPGESVSTLDDAREVAARLGWPVVVKPLVGNHGRGITVGVRGPEELAPAFEAAKAVHRRVVIEKTLVGADHRLLVIGHKLVAAARRDPAQVIGDGASTLRQLVDATNADPRRGEGHEKPLTRIALDDATLRLLERQGLTLDSVPADGERVLLKTTANLSAGGTAVDVTDEVHPAVRLMAERVSRLVDLDVMGIDVVAPHLRRPLQETGGGVCEVNAAPGFRMHLEPSAGEARNVAAPLLDLLFPDGARGTIPIVAVTGTNGKTTTVRLVSHLLRQGGARVGMTCTGGVEVDGHPVLEGDYSGPSGAEAVLTDPTVDHAVLEVARGGILRRGLGFDACDVGVVLNVGSDHLGEGGVETLEDLSRVKGVVAEAVKDGGTLVLNAEDPICLQLRERASRRAALTLFALDPENAALRAHVAAGGTGVSVCDGHVVLQRPGGETQVAALADAPVTLGGKAAFNVQNVLAAVGAAHALGVPLPTLARGLATFAPTAAQSPGRMNLLELGRFKVLLDYGHNVPALHALAQVLPHLAGGRLLNVGSASGNRRDEDLRAFGEALAQMYDEVVLCDPDPRGRPPGATAELVREGVLAGGLAPEAVQVVLDEPKAIETGLAMARDGDLLVLQVDDVKMALALVQAWKPRPTTETPMLVADGPAARVMMAQ